MNPMWRAITQTKIPPMGGTDPVRTPPPPRPHYTTLAYQMAGFPEMMVPHMQTPMGGPTFMNDIVRPPGPITSPAELLRNLGSYQSVAPVGGGGRWRFGGGPVQVRPV